MSIYRNKRNLIVIQNCREDGNSIKGDLRKNGIEWSTGFSIQKDDAEQLFNETELQQKIESAVAEHDKLIKDEIQEWKDCANRSAFENQKLIDKNKSLLYEIEEIKAKVPQPIEVSQKLAEEIEFYKESYEENWFYFITSNSTLNNFNQLLEIFNNGYTVKPDPLREGIASLVARYTNDDGIKDETDLINQLVDYAKAHFKE